MRARTGFLLTVIVAGLAACATPPTDPADRAEFDRVNDPIEPANRVVYRVNDFADRNVLAPVARGYRSATPEGFRTGVNNVLYNAASPGILANDIVQGKPRRAGDTLMRFAINSTVGVLGIMDVASKWGYPRHDSDVGQTLGVYGVGEGPFLNLPLLGPSNPRDTAGFAVGQGLEPLSYGQGTALLAASLGKAAVSTVAIRERLLDPIDNVKKTALDPYATFRSLYRQQRAADIQAVHDDTRATVPAWYR